MSFCASNTLVEKVINRGVAEMLVLKYPGKSREERECMAKVLMNEEFDDNMLERAEVVCQFFMFLSSPIGIITILVILVIFLICCIKCVRCIFC